MSADFSLDSDYIGLIYRDEITEITKTSFGPEDHKIKKVKENLETVSTAIFYSMKEALKNDFNRICYKFTYQKYHGNYCQFEDLVRKIFHEVLNVSCEKSKQYETLRANPHSSSEYIVGDLFVSWKHSQNKELRALLGLTELPEEVDVEKKRLNQFRKEKKFCDYTLLVKEREFAVHKVVLAKYSDYFDAFFSAQFKEAQANAPAKFGEEELTPEVFEALLQYIYTRTVDFSKADASFLIQLANLAKLCMDDTLLHLCVSKLLTAINEKSFFEIASFATIIEDKRLVASCRHYLAKNASLIEAIDFAKMDAKQLVDCHDMSDALQCEALRATATKLLITKIDKDHLQELCEAVNSSHNKKLQDEFKAAAFTFVAANKDLMTSDALKPARKAYQALMTGLERPAKKAKNKE